MRSVGPTLALAALPLLVISAASARGDRVGGSLAESEYRLTGDEAGNLWERLALSSRGSSVVLDLPVGMRRQERFVLEDAGLLPAALDEKYPKIRALRGRSVSDPSAEIRLETGPSGLRARIRRPQGVLYLETSGPGGRGGLRMRSGREAWKSFEAFECGTPSTPRAVVGRVRPGVRSSSTGDTLRELRIAIAATGEFTQQNGGTIESGLAAVTTVLNRVNSIFEREFAIRFRLVDNNDELIYTDPATDPYGDNLLEQNQANIDSVIGDANYDIGHVFGAARGGVVGGRACLPGQKAKGVSNDRFNDLDFFAFLPVSHEIGHQLDAGHTHNSAFNLICELARQPDQAFEPGSGSTVMSYGGICEDENVVLVSDEYFHAGSFEKIAAYVGVGAAASCGASSPTGNRAPGVEAGGRTSIPAATPFVLAGSGVDPDGDVLAFTWEQLDLGKASPPMTDNGRRPLFRSFPPSSSPVRILPRPADLRSGQATLGETLPGRKRKLTFRLTARDGLGGVASDTVVLRVVKRAGPFRVTTPLAGDVWTAGEDARVEWDVARTDKRPINCKTVSIHLSTDGGLTFDSVLAAATSNDGAESVRVPGAVSRRARVRVQCSERPFLALSPGNFRVRN